MTLLFLLEKMRRINDVKERAPLLKEPERLLKDPERGTRERSHTERSAQGGESRVLYKTLS